MQKYFFYQGSIIYIFQHSKMMNAQSAQLRPNLLSQTVEEIEEQNRIKKQPFRETTNYRHRQNRRGKTAMIESKHQIENNPSDKDFSKQQSRLEKENSEPAKKPNFLIHFQSDEEDLEQQQPQISKQHQQNQERRDQEILSIPKKNGFLLSLDSEEEQSQAEEQNSKKKFDDKSQKIQSGGLSKVDEQIGKPQFVLDLGQQSEEQTQGERSMCYNGDNEEEEYQVQEQNRQILTLDDLIRAYKDAYYLQPIPLGKVFECVVKRDRNQSTEKYHLYDNVTLRNFVSILKDEDGYLIISRYESTSTRLIPDANRRQRIIGRVISNFFGTQFNCMLEDQPYKAGRFYPADLKKQRVVTVEYETNLFGMKGPRKMKAFMSLGKGFHGKGLNQVHQQQQKIVKDKKQRRVQCFKNKAPRWNNQIGSYVLNFNGRASISSVKNFLMIGQNEHDNVVPKVLFGKFGKQLFNLDVRYPFNLLQGIALAISSFDRKLVCE